MRGGTEWDLCPCSLQPLCIESYKFTSAELVLYYTVLYHTVITGQEFKLQSEI